MKMNKRDKELTIEITTKCQLNCPWCSSKYDKDYELTSIEVIKILEDNANEYGVVRFSGGEPTEHNDLHYFINRAKFFNYKVILLTNGINKFIDDNIDEYHVQWKTITHEFMKYLLDNDKNIIINVVNILEADIDKAINYCTRNNLPIHIMKLQKTGNAAINKLTEVNISMTGQNGCNMATKKLILPSGKEIYCASEKSDNRCSLI